MMLVSRMVLSCISPFLFHSWKKKGELLDTQTQSHTMAFANTWKVRKIKLMHVFMMLLVNIVVLFICKLLHNEEGTPAKGSTVSGRIPAQDIQCSNMDLIQSCQSDAPPPSCSIHIISYLPFPRAGGTSIQQNVIYVCVFHRDWIGGELSTSPCKKGLGSFGSRIKAITHIYSRIYL